MILSRSTKRKLDERYYYCVFYGDIMITEIQACNVCGEKDLKKVIDLGPQPLVDDLQNIGSTTITNKYDIHILFCKKCCTAHQKYHVRPSVLFPKTYHYRANMTQNVLNGMKSLVVSCKKKAGALTGKKVLDIGCNDGSLLNFFKEEGAFTLGVEPTNAFLDISSKVDVKFQSFFNKDIVDRILKDYGSPDIITFTNVFAHINDLEQLIKNLDHLSSNDTLIIIENHYLDSIIKTNQFDTFYHEHPRTYSLNSFVHIAKALNIEVCNVEFPERYGGNIRVFLSNNSAIKKQTSKLQKTLLTEALDFENALLNMNNFVLSWKKDTLEQLKRLSTTKKICGKAFPGRASILINTLNLSHDILPVILEKPNSNKIGYYAPGTKIKILSDDHLSEYNAIINLAWHINDEIIEYIKTTSFKGEIYSILPKFEKILSIE